MTFGRRAKLAHELLLELFSNPAVSVARIEKQLSISTSSAHRLANELDQAGILKEITGFSRNRIFILHEYIELFKR